MTLTDETSPSPFPVLIVEDDRFLRGVLEDMLAEAGYPVEAVSNGAEALRLMAQGAYRILITDWVMPGMDGLELCRLLRRKPSDRYTYILMLTAHGEKEDLIAGLEAGADEYLVKPVNPVELNLRLKIAQRILNLERSLRQSIEEIKQLSLKDPLTGLYNRRFLVERLPQEIKRSYRYSRPLSLVMVDIDHFKAINDTYGHPAGDAVLKVCAGCLMETVRDDLDWVVRYGGEEFVLVLPETDLDGALAAAERLRQRAAEERIGAEGQQIRITASFGVASLPPQPKKEWLRMESLLECADRCLYRAKREGRNRVRGLRL